MKMVIALVLVMSASFAQAKTMRVQKCVKKKGAKSVVCAYKAAPVAAAQPSENCYFSTEQAATICTAVRPSYYVPYSGPSQASNCYFNNEQAATICEYPTHTSKPQGTSVSGLPFGNQPVAPADDNCHKDWESGLTVCE